MIFGDPFLRLAWLKRAATAWRLQSRYLGKTRGAEAAVNYLLEKTRLVEHIQGYVVPAVSLELGLLYYNDLHQLTAASEALKQALASATADGDSDTHSEASSALAELGARPESSQAPTSGCLALLLAMALSVVGSVTVVFISLVSLARR
jgi:hypothetical protein